MNSLTRNDVFVIRSFDIFEYMGIFFGCNKHLPAVLGSELFSLYPQRNNLLFEVL